MIEKCTKDNGMEIFLKREFESILNKIENADIREKIIKAWILAADKGEWSVKEIQRIPFTLLTKNEGVNLFDHALAVTRGAAGLAEAIIFSYPVKPFDINWDFLYAGGLLHDIGKLIEIKKTDNGYKNMSSDKCQNHSNAGVIILKELGLQEEIISIVDNCSGEGEPKPKSIEAILIHQSDIAMLDSIIMKRKNF